MDQMISFLLPETAAEFGRRVAAAEAEAARARAANLQQAAQLRGQADAAAASASVVETEAGSPARRELNRRAAERLRSEVARLRCEAQALEGAAAPAPDRAEIEKELRGAELFDLAHQGEIILQNFSEVPVATRHLRRERRLVRYGGRVFIVSLLWEAGPKARLHKGDGGYKSRDWTEYLPPGPWRAPTPEWASDSLAQMTDRELEAIA